MDLTKRHIKKNYTEAHNSYWDTFDKLEEKKITLEKLKRDITFMTSQLEKLKNRKDKFEKMLREVDPDALL